MMIDDLKKRWRTAEGQVRSVEAWRYLAGGGKKRPADMQTADGRLDLRGISLPAPEVIQRVSASNIDADVLRGAFEFRDVAWVSVDFSAAILPSLRFFDALIEGCVFDGARLRDLRLWGSEVKRSTFVGADLRDGVLGTWHDGRSNAWLDVAFDDADLRHAFFRGGLLDHIRFTNSRLVGGEFQQVDLRDSLFRGELREVVFDGRDAPGRPAASPYENVDFSDADLAEVEFRGCRFVNVSLPPSVQVIPHYPAKAREALRRIDQGTSLDERTLRSFLQTDLKLPGADDSVGVFNRADYVVWGGETLAELAEQILLTR